MIVTYTSDELCKSYLHIPNIHPWKMIITDLTNLDEDNCSKFSIKLFARYVEETIFSTDQLVHQEVENWDDKIHQLCVYIADDIAEALASALRNGQGILDLDKIIDICQEDWKDQLMMTSDMED